MCVALNIHVARSNPDGCARMRGVDDRPRSLERNARQVVTRLVQQLVLALIVAQNNGTGVSAELDDALLHRDTGSFHRAQRTAKRRRYRPHTHACSVARPARVRCSVIEACRVLYDAT